MDAGTDLEAPIEVAAEEASFDAFVSHATDRELLELCIRQQRTMIEQFSAIVTSFSEVQGAIQQGGIAGLLKGLMGR